MGYAEIEERFAIESLYADARRQDAIRSFLKVAEAKLESDVCLLSRGSLARGDFCRHSDIDLILLTGSLKSDWRAVIEKMQEIVSYPISVQLWSPSTPSDKINSLHVWYSVSQCQYLAGNRDLFHYCKLRWLKLLSRLDGKLLICLHNSDPRRHKGLMRRTSPLSFNVKRGRGGIVDYEFAHLVTMWLELGPGASDLQYNLIHVSRSCFKYLFVLKSFLHEIFDFPCDSSARLFELEDSLINIPSIFHKSFIIDVQERHLTIIEKLKHTLTGD
jgi:hypothetical protein